MAFEGYGNIKATIFKFFCVLCPSVTLWMLLPFIKELPPLAIPNNLNWFQIYLAGSYYLGILAAPGFLYALFTKQVKIPGEWLRRWVRLSVYAAFFASTGGLTSVLAILPAPFAIGSVVCSFLVLKRFRAQNRSLKESL